MPNVPRLLKSLFKKPRYTIMRGLGRFRIVRDAVAKARSIGHRNAIRKQLAECRARLGKSIFEGINPERFVDDLRRDGVAFGLKLPAGTVADIRNWASQNACYADRNPNHGFRLNQRGAAEDALGKPILLAQYYNSSTECPAVAQLLRDPFLEVIAMQYFGSIPTMVGTNLWWTFPVNASESDRNQHAHFFHRDVDDFRFFKVFFYITDVEQGDGAHVCVIGSQRNPPIRKFGDQWNIRRYTDNEIVSEYPTDRILEIYGSAGTGFAEDTLCIHKGLTPTRNPRLLLQLQFALFDYGVMHDHKSNKEIRSIV